MTDILTPSQLHREKLQEKILSEFEMISRNKPETKKTAIIHFLASKHGVSERKIWKILSNVKGFKEGETE